MFISHDNRSICNALTFVGVFEDMSRRHINMAKCSLAGINMADNIVNSLAEAIGCRTPSWPIVYLDIPLGGNPRLNPFGMVHLAKCPDG